MKTSLLTLYRQAMQREAELKRQMRENIRELRRTASKLGTSV
jgi:hypothetical protein